VVMSFRDDPVLLKDAIRTVDLALQEDAGLGDITTEALFDENDASEAVVTAGDQGVVAGIPLFVMVYERISGLVNVRKLVNEGDRVKAGTEVIRLSGPTVSLLKGERTALNFLQRISGIATMTSRMVERVAPYGISILDTRKTTPSLRLLEKYAVRVGGGTNHRVDLADMYLIKENHKVAAGGISEALRKVFEGKMEGKEVEVEVDSIEELREAMIFPVDRIMLDNFAPEDAVDAIRMVVDSRGMDGLPKIEISGGVREDNIGLYCRAGVDYISVGALTHSVSSLDISMNIIRVIR